MQTALVHILKNYFQKESLESVSEAELVEFSRKYPFATIGHLLLAKKKKWWGNDYQKEAEKTALYLNNPLWLHYLLQMETEKAENIQQDLENRPGGQATQELIAPVNTTETVSAAVEKEVQTQAIAAASATESTDTALIEPYHTIDYFASQGIKLRMEDLGKDRFGQQLKSFTEWLKGMKRLQPVTKTTIPEQPVDEKIENSAASSIASNNVETEAMAEVWVKQGNKEKAMEIYRKLSLHNPSKSHYFAAKIEQLNLL